MKKSVEEKCWLVSQQLGLMAGPQPLARARYQGTREARWWGGPRETAGPLRTNPQQGPVSNLSGKGVRGQDLVVLAAVYHDDMSALSGPRPSPPGPELKRRDTRSRFISRNHKTL